MPGLRSLPERFPERYLSHWPWGLRRSRRPAPRAGPVCDNRTMPAPLLNDTFLRACLCQPTEYTPVWLMRQAGRYLPEYKASRARAGSFMGLATSPDYATEVTLQPLERYPLDAAILFSDILTVPDAMGLGLSFAEGEGPRFARPVRDEADVARLAVPDMARLRYVFDAVASIRRALDGRVPLIGFSGSPWTLACYMVEGAGSDDYRRVKTMLYSRPDLMHRILAVNADAVAAYLNAQIEAGAQAVMIFDSWGGVLADGAFQAFSLAYTRRVLEQLRAHPRRPHGALDRLHQGWRRLAGGHRRTGPGRHRPRLDGQPGRCPATCRQRARRCRAMWTRTSCSHPRRRSPRRSGGRCAAWPRRARSTAMSSTSATASASSRRRTTLPPSWRPCIGPRDSSGYPARRDFRHAAGESPIGVSGHSVPDLSPKRKSDGSYAIVAALQHHYFGNPR